VGEAVRRRETEIAVLLNRVAKLLNRLGHPAIHGEIHDQAVELPVHSSVAAESGRRGISLRGLLEGFPQCPQFPFDKGRHSSSRNSGGVWLQAATKLQYLH
jgi:hypothetical protein